MKRRAILAAIAVLLSACALIEAEPIGSTTANVAPAEGSTTTSPATTATTRSDCTAADPDIVLLCEAIDLIQRRYVDDVPDAELIDSGVESLTGLAEGRPGDLGCEIDDAVAQPVCEAIDSADVDVLEGVERALTAMAFSLDPNSAYLDPEALELAEDDTSGRVEGIGALVNAEDSTAADPLDAQCSVITDTCRLVVVSTFQNSPAQQAGVLPGDSIVRVDGQSIDGLHIDEVTEMVRGPAGTEVVVGFERAGESIEVTMVRESVDIPIAEWEMVGDVGYMRFNLFTVDADTQIRRGLEELIGEGARGVVLDLRDNPGGALQAAVEVASEFLAEGDVVRTESPEDEQTYRVTGEGVATDPDLELWVVVNEGSASASEVVAGVLGETDRATVLGENTFGKNTVQQRFPLGNGGALKLTIARWVTPSGQDFGTIGITPDIAAEFPYDLTPEQVVERVLELTGGG